MALNIDGMISFMVQENSPFTDEGKNLLIEEFGKNYATYFSILSTISGAIKTQPEIEGALRNKSIGGQLLKQTTQYMVLCWKDISSSNLPKVSNTGPLAHCGNPKAIKKK